MPTFDRDAQQQAREDLDEDTRDVRMALAIEDGLSEWELGFVESIGRQVLDSKRVLTENQRVKLDEILDRHG